MKTNIKRKPLILVVAILLAVVTVAGATFAWFTASDDVTNRLATKDALANVHIQETFVEPDDWKPGQTITKEVAIADVGTAPALVRVSFAELLKVNQPPEAEEAPFDEDMEDEGKKPLLFDNTLYTGGDWFEVTTDANAAKGGIKLAGAYADVKVYAKYVAPSGGGGSIGSYSFAVWAPIEDTAFDGKLQAVNYTREWDGDTKTLTLKDIGYLTYQGEIEQSADWTDDPPDADDIDKSIAETLINAMTGVAGKYPNNIQLNYTSTNMTDAAGLPTAENKWFYNEDDGYFYFIGLVEPGTVTPNMLASLLLQNTADSDYYANMVFDLIVNMDAIQHTKDAVDSLWAISDTTLKAAIHALCES